MSDNTIVRCVIHPGIGLARIGNSPTDFFIGPEMPGIMPNPGGGYKDAQGRIKRQVARFRLYGLNAAGQVVKELTANDAQITWTVYLANKKATWYQFQLALDVPEATAAGAPVSKRRNAHYTGQDRQKLVIDPEPRSISGKNTQGPAYGFDSGTFLGTPVYLGELRTGGAGNLLVFGGMGHSATPQANNPATTFANNDGWHDDIADGPVTASVTLGGASLPVTPAWVIVGPPNYAPGIRAIVTLYDIAYEAYLDAHPQQPRLQVSFTRHIYPILERFDRLQWVNQGFYEGYGWKGQVPLLDPSRLQQLASNAASSAQARNQIFARFRDPAYQALQEDAWPRVYGDSFDQPPHYPQQYLAVTREQYRCLSEWANGNFLADWRPDQAKPQMLGDLPLQDRPHALDEAALSACSGGPFHPGVEATWPMRRPSMYADLCRLVVRRSSDPPEPDYGDVLTPARALGADGPFHRSGPGDITRWMAVPWQTDTSSCGSAYPNSTQQPSPLPDLPTFWPAAVPNKILTQKAYQRILDGGLSPAQRQATFATRAPWARHLAPDYHTRINEFVTDWYQLGVIAPQPGPSNDAGLPSEMHVETESGFPEDVVPRQALLMTADGEPPPVEELPSQPMLENWRAHL